MSLNQEEIKKLSKLAMVELSEKDIEEMNEDFIGVFKIIDQLNELATITQDVEPLSNVLETSQRLRKDEVNIEIEAELYQKNSMKTEGNFYLVPKVIK